MNFSTRNPHAPPQNKTKTVNNYWILYISISSYSNRPEKRNSLTHEVFSEITTISQTSIKFIGVDKRKFDHDVCKYQPYLIKMLKSVHRFWLVLFSRKKKIIIANCFVLFWEISRNSYQKFFNIAWCRSQICSKN